MPKSTTSRAAKPSPKAADAPIPFKPTEPAPKPKPLHVPPGMTAAEVRALNEEGDRRDAARARRIAELRAANERATEHMMGPGAFDSSRYPADLPLPSLLAYALCGEVKPWPEVILSSLVTDMDAVSIAITSGTEIPYMMLADLVYGWVRRVQVAAELVTRLRDAEAEQAEQAERAKAAQP